MVPADVLWPDHLQERLMGVPRGCDCTCEIESQSQPPAHDWKASPGGSLNWRPFAVKSRVPPVQQVNDLLEQVVSLRKYAKAYDLDIAPTAPKEDLIFAIMKHWTHQVCPTASPDESLSCSAVTVLDKVIFDWQVPSSWAIGGSHCLFSVVPAAPAP
jgi:hypothetical protein